jgi:2-keto-4-pentenoate hydratase
MTDATSLAEELMAASANRRSLDATPSARDPSFDLTAAYRVSEELTRLVRAAGHKTVGVKVGFANKAMWRTLKLDTLVWGPMYDHTVQYATNGEATLAISRMVSPKIEPEIVFKLKRPVTGERADPAAVLDAVEWLALGFEVIDCPFPDWKFQPVDFVAAFGLHAALIVGTPLPIDETARQTLVDELARFHVSLLKNGQTVAEGSGRNSLRSPALCLGELAFAMSAWPGTEPLDAGALVSSGTLTDSQLIAPGEMWRAEVSGIGLAPVTVQIV